MHDAGVPVLAKYHVLAGHMALKGDVLETNSSDGRSVQALAVSGNGGLTVWVSNLTGQARTVSLSGVPEGGTVTRLDAASFEAACADPHWRSNAAKTGLNSSSLELDAYAIAEIRFGYERPEYLLESGPFPVARWRPVAAGRKFGKSR